MPLAPMLRVLALLLPLQGAFQEAHGEFLTVVEGQNLDLHCKVASGHNRSTLEWKNPKGFVIFFNNQRGLRDQRYKLTHFSKDAISISLSSVTMQDEGLYTCLHYGETTQRKEVNVSVLAVPSQPLLEALRIRSPNEEEKVMLKCSTWGSKPPPQITWLLDNGVELFGNTEHQLDVKKYNSTGTLTVHTYTKTSSFTCIIRHKVLGGGNLTATLQLKLTKSTTDLTPNASEFSTVTLRTSQDYTALDKILNATEANYSTPTPTPSIETSTLNINSTTSDSEKKPNITEENLSVPAPSLSSGAATPNPNTTTGSHKILNVTEGKFAAWTTSTNTDTAVVNSNATEGTNLTAEGIVKKKASLLLPALVTVLLVILSIIVLLFLVKLGKAHRKWKKENEASEQTLESNRSRPNDDNYGQEKSKQVVPWNASKKYVIRGSCVRTSKNSEGSQDSSVFEKHIPYLIRETDL